jgi:hypothetical protein
MLLQIGRNSKKIPMYWIHSLLYDNLSLIIPSIACTLWLSFEMTISNYWNLQLKSSDEIFRIHVLTTDFNDKYQDSKCHK